MERNERLIELLIETLGAETLLDELLRALTADEVTENLEYIARNWDISTEGL